MNSHTEQIHRATGLLVIEVINSNPNGDPDRESDPRWRPDERGEISPVSVKRKIRDLVDDKEGFVWQQVSSAASPALDASEFAILESRGRDRAAVLQEIKSRHVHEEVLGWPRVRQYIPGRKNYRMITFGAVLCNLGWYLSCAGCDRTIDDDKQERG